MNNILEIYQDKLFDLSQVILDDFLTYLLDLKVSPKTARIHAENARIFLVNFMNFQYLQHVGEITQEKVRDFTNLWYFQKIENPSRRKYAKIIASLKKFIDFLGEHEIIKLGEKKVIRGFLSDQSHFSLCYDGFEANPAKYPIHNEEFMSSLDNFVQDFSELGNFEQSLEDLSEEFDEEKLEDWEEFDEGYGIKDYNDCTLDEILSEINDICHLSGMETKPPKNNLIELIPRMGCKVLSESQYKEPANKEERQDILGRECLCFLRANRVFERWLDRNFIHPSTIPPVNASICICSTAIVERIYEMLSEANIKEEDLSKTLVALNQLDRSIWLNRESIAKNAGLNLVEFIL